MKFHSVNVFAKQILNSQRNIKITSRRVYLLIKRHNDLCFMLERFNDFWKQLLVIVLAFYIFFLWLSVYIPVVYSKIDFIAKLFMYLMLFEVIAIFTSIVMIIFNVSIEVMFFSV